MPNVNAGYNQPIYRQNAGGGVAGSTITPELTRQEIMKQKQMEDMMMKQMAREKMTADRQGLAGSSKMDQYLRDRDQRIQGAAYLNPRAIYERLFNQ